MRTLDAVSRGRWLVPLLAGLFLLVGPVTAQEPDDEPPPPPPGAQDTVQLIFDREVFTYPAHQRRNPFRPLSGPGDAGPRFEELTLMAVVLSPDPGGSLAVFQVPGTPEAGGGVHRLREGQTLGNVRVVEIRFREVVVEVEEFGLRERVTMRLERGGPGAGPAAGEPLDLDPETTDPDPDDPDAGDPDGDEPPPSQGDTTTSPPDTASHPGVAYGGTVVTGGSGDDSGTTSGLNGNGGN